MVFDDAIVIYNRIKAHNYPIIIEPIESDYKEK